MTKVESSLFETGIRPVIDAHLAKLAEEKRNYGKYWSASSAGYCQRKLIFERLGVPPVEKDEARKQRVFESGKIFHEWVQRITKDAGLSIAQELELVDDQLMIKGHCDDLINIDGHLILYDYKSAHSRSFHYAKDKPMSFYHKMQVGTYMYMLRQESSWEGWSKVRKQGYKYDLPYKLMSLDPQDDTMTLIPYKELGEARVMKISKDDLCMVEHQLLWTPALEKEVVSYWKTLNGYWKRAVVPKCTCHVYENGFLAREAFNPYFYNGKPCSTEWMELKLKEKK